jgi:hypothetical protein
VALTRSNPLRLVEPFRRAGVQPLLPPASADEVRIRRCTFRLMSMAGGDLRLGAGSAYQVSCRYPDLERRVPLGDITAARAICAICTATGIFRADED